MNLYNNELYLKDLNYIANLNLPWRVLENKSFIISGATGMIGSFLVDALLNKDINLTIYALARNTEGAKERFSKYLNDNRLVFVDYDVNESLNILEINQVDYILHLASNTHPLQYSTDPIGTITTNIIGLKNMLDFAVKHNCERFLFASSNEIYGENRGDVELFDEHYCGYIDSNTLRAGYPESKRCGEALCQAYIKQKGLNIVIPRFTRTYGPTMKLSDTKAISQFIKKAINKEDIILKSKGYQYYSYQYVADSVSGLLYVLFYGKNGEAYNISDESSDITLKDLAQLIANISNTNVVFEIPDEIESVGYSRATKARLDGNKLKKTGWMPRYSINEGLKKTIYIMSRC